MPVAEGKEGETKNEAAEKKEHKPESKQAKSRSSSPLKTKTTKAGKLKPIDNAAEPKPSAANAPRPTAESKAKSTKSKPDRTRNDAANSKSSRAPANATTTEAKATTGTAPLLNPPAGRVPTSKPAPGSSWRDRLRSPTASAASKAPAAQAINNRSGGNSAPTQANGSSRTPGRVGIGAWSCFSSLVCTGGGNCCSRNGALEMGPPDPDARDSPGCASREGCVLLWCNSGFVGNSCHTLQYACCAPLACAQRGAQGFGHACLVGLGDMGCGDQCCAAWALGSGLRNRSTSSPPPPLLPSGNDGASAAVSANPNDPNAMARNALLAGLAGCARPDDVGGVRVLGTDRPLLDDVALLHPVVRLHAVNIHTGHYLQWQPPAATNDDQNSSGAAHAASASNKIVRGGSTLLWERGEGQEPGGGSNNGSAENTGGLQFGAPQRSVAPVATHPFPLRRRMEAPRWGVDEAWGHGADSGELLLDAPYASLLHPDCLLLVEVVDFGCAGRPVGGAKGRKPFSAHNHPGSSSDHFSGLHGGDDDDEDDDDIDGDEGPLAATGYSSAGMHARGNSLNRSGHHRSHGGGGSSGLAAASSVGRSGPSPKGTAAARVRRGQGYTGVCWGFLKPIGRGGRPTVGVRGSNLGEAAWGATPRTDLDLGGVDRLSRSGNGNSHANTNQGENSSNNDNNDDDDGTSDVARLDRRVSLQLFKWQALGPVALAQAVARGLAPLPAPAASPVPLVYLQWLLRARRYYPATLTIRVGPVPRSLALRRCGADGAGSGWQLLKSALHHSSGLGLLGGKRAHLEALQLGGAQGGNSNDNGRFASSEAAAGNGGIGANSAAGATSAPVLGRDKPMEPHVLARAWQPGERCAVPDRVMARCVLGGTLNGGTTALAFSRSGRYLAVAAVAASSDGASGHSSGGTGGVSGVPLHPVLIFDVNKEDGRTVLRGPPLVGHVGVVHALAWSHDDKFLLSASSDGTARVWNMARVTHRRKMEQEARAAAQAHALADAQAIAQKFMERDESKASTNDENNANATNSNGDATRNQGGAPMDSLTDDDALDHTANDEGAALLQPPKMRRAGSMSGGVPSTAPASVTEDGANSNSGSSGFGASSDGGVLVRILAHSPPAFIHAAAFLPLLASGSTRNSASGSPNKVNTDSSTSEAANGADEENASPNRPEVNQTADKTGRTVSNLSSVPLLLRGCPRVVTCASDGSVRMWDPTTPDHPDLGLFGGFRAPLHRRGATAVAVDTVSRRVYTADADGVVWPWVSTSGLHASSPSASLDSSAAPPANDADPTAPQSRSTGGASYCPDGRPLSHSMLRGRCVTSLALQPSRRNPRLRQYGALASNANSGSGSTGGNSARHLLVAAQGNVLLLFDLGARALLATYLGASIRTSPIKACFSPDGCYVLCGSEEGSVSVWTAENDPRSASTAAPPTGISPSPLMGTGAPAAGPVTSTTNPLVASMPRHPSSALTTMAFNAPMLCVAWNPAQHAVALGAAGGPYPVLLACADKPLDDDADDAISFPAGTLGGHGSGPSSSSSSGYAGVLNGNGEEEEDARVIAARLNLAKREKVRAKLDQAKAAGAATSNGDATTPAAAPGSADDLMTPRDANRTALLPEADGFTFGGGGNNAPSGPENAKRAAVAQVGFAGEPPNSAVNLMSRTAPLPNDVPNLQLPSMSRTANDALDAASF